MDNKFQDFSELASELKERKDNIKHEQSVIKGNDTTPSLTNTVAWCAFRILASEDATEIALLTASIAKDAPLNHAKQFVSMAKKVLNTLEAGESIIVDDNQHTYESIKELASYEGVPVLTINALYKSSLAASKVENEASKRERSIAKEALATLQAQYPDIAMTAKQLNMHPNKAKLLADAAIVVDSRLAAEARAKGEESRTEAFNRIVNEIISNGFENEILNALTSSGEAHQAA